MNRVKLLRNILKDITDIINKEINLQDLNNLLKDFNVYKGMLKENSLEAALKEDINERVLNTVISNNLLKLKEAISEIVSEGGVCRNFEPLVSYIAALEGAVVLKKQRALENHNHHDVKDDRDEKVVNPAAKNSPSDILDAIFNNLKQVNIDDNASCLRFCSEFSNNFTRDVFECLAEALENKIDFYYECALNLDKFLEKLRDSSFQDKENIIGNLTRMKILLKGLKERFEKIKRLDAVCEVSKLSLQKSIEDDLKRLPDNAGQKYYRDEKLDISRLIAMEVAGRTLSMDNRASTGEYVHTNKTYPELHANIRKCNAVIELQKILRTEKSGKDKLDSFQTTLSIHSSGREFVGGVNAILNPSRPQLNFSSSPQQQKEPEGYWSQFKAFVARHPRAMKIAGMVCVVAGVISCLTGVGAIHGTILSAAGVGILNTVAVATAVNASTCIVGGAAAAGVTKLAKNVFCDPDREEKLAAIKGQSLPKSAAAQQAMRDLESALEGRLHPTPSSNDQKLNPKPVGGITITEDPLSLFENLGSIGGVGFRC